MNRKIVLYFQPLAIQFLTRVENRSIFSAPKINTKKKTHHSTQNLKIFVSLIIKTKSLSFYNE